MSSKKRINVICRLLHGAVFRAKLINQRLGFLDGLLLFQNRLLLRDKLVLDLGSQRDYLCFDQIVHLRVCEACCVVRGGVR